MKISIELKITMFFNTKIILLKQKIRQHTFIVPYISARPCNYHKTKFAHASETGPDPDYSQVKINLLYKLVVFRVIRESLCERGAAPTERIK